ncbi:transposase, partial [Enterobacter roggenkampii]|uniref:transposase n=1 Tax=Enterobacter roggenkampii TaxID=1812935 RepID=UPI00374EBC5B
MAVLFLRGCCFKVLTLPGRSAISQSTSTSANEHDLNQLGNLLHGEEQFVSADAGYQGAPQREELAEVDVDWLIAER